MLALNGIMACVISPNSFNAKPLSITQDICSEDKCININSSVKLYLWSFCVYKTFMCKYCPGYTLSPKSKFWSRSSDSELPFHGNSVLYLTETQTYLRELQGNLYVRSPSNKANPKKINRTTSESSLWNALQISGRHSRLLQVLKEKDKARFTVEIWSTLFTK